MALFEDPATVRIPLLTIAVLRAVAARRNGDDGIGATVPDERATNGAPAPVDEPTPIGRGEGVTPNRSALEHDGANHAAAVRLADRLFAALLAAPGTYVSGSALAARFGVSRTAIWKAANRLMEAGFPVERAHRRGYRLAEGYDPPVGPNGWEGLEGAELGQAFRFFPEVDSTQNAARRWFDDGAPHGAVVLAERQTAGRGRMGRQWVSPPGTGLWMSVILTDGLRLADVHALSLMAGLAVAEALEAFGYRPGLKWPNDVLLAGKKVAGVLIEGQGELDRLYFAVVGIGLNVRLPEAFPPELRTIATALAEHGPPPPRRKLAAAILSALDRELRAYRAEGFGPLRERWLVRAVSLGREIAVETGGGRIVGRFAGLDDDGKLLVETAAGLRAIASGEVRL
ncbi:biotin--[acetyl-CoA-carboxylase] ligase [Hydrogenibacillus schlegelii]